MTSLSKLITCDCGVFIHYASGTKYKNRLRDVRVTVENNVAPFLSGHSVYNNNNINHSCANCFSRQIVCHVYKTARVVLIPNCFSLNV